MVIVRLKGGLGNQLFQFAFGRALSTHKEHDLYFDLTDLEMNPQKYKDREFRLQKIKNVKMGNDVVYQEFNDLFDEGRVIVVDDYLPKNLLTMLIQDREIQGILLNGYFQDEIYCLWSVDTIQEELREFFHPYARLGNAEKLIPEAQQSVAIHLRRGDYLEKKTFSIHGILEAPYYEQAIAIIRSRLRHPYFYIFTDDIPAADELFSGLGISYTNVSAIVNANISADKDLIEMALMSQCKHFIIANSSFSWWGSYLSDWINKIVIAPQNWFKDEAYKQKSDHIGVPNWIRI